MLPSNTEGWTSECQAELAAEASTQQRRNSSFHQVRDTINHQ